MKAIAIMLTILGVATARPTDTSRIPNTYGRKYTADGIPLRKFGGPGIGLNPVPPTLTRAMGEISPMLVRAAPRLVPISFRTIPPGQFPPVSNKALVEAAVGAAAVGGATVAALGVAGSLGTAKAIAGTTMVGAAGAGPPARSSPRETGETTERGPKETALELMKGMYYSGLVPKPAVIASTLAAGYEPEKLSRIPAETTGETETVTTSERPKPEATTRPEREENAGDAEVLALAELKDLYAKAGFLPDTYPCHDDLKCLHDKTPTYWLHEIKACQAKTDHYWAGAHCLRLMPNGSFSIVRRETDSLTGRDGD